MLLAVQIKRIGSDLTFYNGHLKGVQDGTQWKWLELSPTLVPRSFKMLVYLLKKLEGRWNWIQMASGVLFLDLSLKTLHSKRSK